MAIKAGAILHDVNGFVVDRVQSAGPGNLNIPEEKIYELGNWGTIATVRDIPDLSFDLESFDVFSEFEGLLLGKDGAANPGSAAVGNQLSGQVGSNEVDFKNHVPIDVISPFKSRRDAYDIVKGLAVPYLTLERATYRYGLRQNATQAFTLRGDSIYYTPGVPRYQTETLGANVGASSYTFDYSPGIVYYEGAEAIYAFCVVAVGTNGSYRRLFEPSDYQSTSTGVALTAAGYEKAIALSSNGATPGEVTLRFVYATTTASNPATYQTTNPSGNAVHTNASLKPAAVRPKDIDVYIADSVTSLNWTRMNSVQSAEVSWSVTLENDEEFGNKHYVAQDYDVPNVTGTIGVKPFDPADLWNKLAQITGLPTTQVIGPEITVPVPILVEVRHPDTGAIVKSIYCPDARFQVPGLQGRIQTKLETTFSFTSDAGDLSVFNGDSGLR